MREERGIKFPNECFSSTGKLLIHGASSFSHHSVSCLFPSPPAVLHLLHPLSVNTLMYSSSLIPCSFISYFSCDSLSHTFRFSSLFFLLPLLYLHHLHLNLLFYLFRCVLGLWGRWVLVHHQSNNHSYGKLLLPRLWI